MWMEISTEKWPMWVVRYWESSCPLKPHFHMSTVAHSKFVLVISMEIPTEKWSKVGESLGIVLRSKLHFNLSMVAESAMTMTALTAHMIVR